MRLIPLLILLTACAPWTYTPQVIFPDPGARQQYERQRDFVREHNRRFNAIRHYQRARRP